MSPERVTPITKVEVKGREIRILPKFFTLEALQEAFDIYTEIVKVEEQAREIKANNFTR